MKRRRGHTACVWRKHYRYVVSDIVVKSLTNHDMPFIIKSTTVTLYTCILFASDKILIMYLPS